MAKLKATPKNFAEALTVLQAAKKSSLRLGNNTYLETGNDTEVYVAVRLHRTEIVRFYADGRTTLHTGGYYTVTTKERINHFITGRVYQSNGEWYHSPNFSGYMGNERIFEHFTEGMEV